MTREQAQRNIALAEALESGKYKQTRDHGLRGRGMFCCLGVACDLVAPEAWSDSDSHLGVDDYPDPQIKDMYGWDSCNPTLHIDGTEASAAMHNDDLGATFPEIAKGFRLLAAQEYEGEAK